MYLVTIFLHTAFGFVLATCLGYQQRLAILPHLNPTIPWWELLFIALWLVAFAYQLWQKPPEKRVLLGLAVVVLLGVARALFLGGVWADEAGEAGGEGVFYLAVLALGTLSAGVFVLRQATD